MRTMPLVSRLLAVILPLGPALWLGACAASPRQRPVEGGPVSTGPGSLEFTRRQLEGNQLVSSVVDPQRRTITHATYTK